MATVTRSNVDAAARRIISSVARQFLKTGSETPHLTAILGAGVYDKYKRSANPQKNATQACLEELYEIYLVQNDGRFGQGDRMGRGEKRWRFRDECIRGYIAFADVFDWAGDGFASRDAFEQAMRDECEHPRAHTINEGA